LGFTFCDSDARLFVPDRCIFLVQADGTLLYAHSQSDIDDAVNTNNRNITIFLTCNEIDSPSLVLKSPTTTPSSIFDANPSEWMISTSQKNVLVNPVGMDIGRRRWRTIVRSIEGSNNL
jgi:hypothetical protein